MAAKPDSTTFGSNAWLVDEMYDRYRADPTSVAESWQEFFADYRPADGEAAAPAPSAPAPAAASTPAASTHAADGDGAAAAPAPAPAAAKPTAAPATPVVSEAVAIRGAGARIVANMEASLAVPTATST